MTLSARRAEAVGARLPPLLVAAERVASTVAQGVHGRRRVGQGDSFWQFRRFVAGDPIARIDWRQSANAPTSCSSLSPPSCCAAASACC